jgi:aspartate ammonia-lyase
MDYRVEHDYLGPVRVPKPAYWGAQTQRAAENFKVSGLRPFKEYTYSIILIKKAAALANVKAGLMDKKKGLAIARACDEALSGKFDDQFIVDVYQAGEGTSNNMNVNEVIANRAEEILGGKRGEYRLVHPNDDVNRGQSSNDVIPTAIKLASLEKGKELLDSLEALKNALDKKSGEFDSIVKSGRTHLMDAAPIRLGQEFHAWSGLISDGEKRIKNALDGILEINLGATAVGTGLNADKRYLKNALELLRKFTGLKLRYSANLPKVTESPSDLLNLSSALKTLAADMIKITNDLRLMNSGPVTGFAEITLPAVQPGSSIMPGKVNPSILEMVDMVCFQVIGSDDTITLATQAGQFELNVMEPIIEYNLLNSLGILSNASRILADRAISGLTANEDRMRQLLDKTPGVGMALNPYIGYEKASEIVKKAISSGKSIRQVAEESGLLSKQQLDKIFDPYSLTGSKKSMRNHK